MRRKRGASLGVSWVVDCKASLLDHPLVTYGNKGDSDGIHLALVFCVFNGKGYHEEQATNPASSL
jgi:hypothetical protein